MIKIESGQILDILFSSERNVLVKEIIHFLKEQKVKHYFVGGAVRDAIEYVIKRTDKFVMQDIDIVVIDLKLNLLVEKILKIKYFRDAKVKLYPEFFTATVIVKDFRIDLSNPRKEKYLYNGSLPKVFKGTRYDDLLRRDFSVNAISLLYFPNIDCYKFYDPCNGIKDLLDKKIKILHKKSFYDDPTRIIRAIRFVSSLNYTFEKHTEKLLKSAIKKNVLEKISKQRLNNEFVLLIKKGENIGFAMKLLEKYNVSNNYAMVKDLISVIKLKSKKLELKNVEQKNRFYIRLMYILDNLPDKKKYYNIKIFIKQKLNILNLSREDKFEIMNAVDVLYFNKGKINSWIDIYLKVFNKKIFVPFLCAQDLIRTGFVERTKIADTLFKLNNLQQIGKIRTKSEAIEFLKRC